MHTAPGGSENRYCAWSGSIYHMLLLPNRLETIAAGAVDSSVDAMFFKGIIRATVRPLRSKELVANLPQQAI